MTGADEVVLDGGSRDGQPVPLDVMRRIDIDDAYVLDDQYGVYWHCPDDVACWKNQQRTAVFCEGLESTRSRPSPSSVALGPAMRAKDVAPSPIVAPPPPRQNRAVFRG
jgi:hypothetical protein